MRCETAGARCGRRSGSNDCRRKPYRKRDRRSPIGYISKHNTLLSQEPCPLLPVPAFAMVHVHNRPNTPKVTPAYVPSVHPLPVEIIRVVSLLLLCRLPSSIKHLDHQGGRRDVRISHKGYLDNYHASHTCFDGTRGTSRRLSTKSCARSPNKSCRELIHDMAMLLLNP